ncbi:hypothetical protein GCM10018793_38200 [Streptomyces sulfonofaciens]|uniref:Beta-N-acetylhexosaminidase n=1 Tax=Streptomyces sulfonofaciens TaxID=68272 RepID=A0A919L296_9ACTN|nr:family 20 glycosylhydrolase [Streptomyces sulfonofaciens]GHH81268.1 hypothetical protein GCM10018793_38200 [Streptomyces sulfonofaciens]
MRHSLPRTTSRWAVRVLSALALLVPTVLPAAATARSAAASPSTGAAASAPGVLPALTHWTPGTGSLRLGHGSAVVAVDRALEADAGVLADDLAGASGLRLPVATGARHRPGDVVLRLDPSRKDLGTEGYALDVSDGVRVTAATETGVYYGTRTLVQMLDGGRSLPRGSAVDVPRYAERGVDVCACYIHVSLAWFERLMRDMSYLKLNQLQIEAKVASDVDPATKFWGYYTKDEVRRLSALAREYHITLVPEINSPGHIDPYLENHPELQLTDSSGAKSPTRLDITKPEAFAFYTKLVDEALSVWDTPYWHMGADEYMLGSDFANYPQIGAYAKAKYGADATPQDAFVDFVNRVDEHVRAGGRTLRIWNDGLNGQNTVPVNKDVVIEHWLTETGAQPSALLAAGNPVMNSAYSLYLVRGGFHMDTQKLYDSDWTPLEFEGESLSGPQPGVTGAQISLWPDSAAAETENEVEADTFMPLRFVAQTTWGGPKPAAGYAGFTALAERVGHAPGWQNVTRLPLADGTYAMSLRGSGERLAAPSADAAAPVRFAAGSSATWALTSTADGYYVLRAVHDGKPGQECLDVVDGKHYLGAPLEVGAAVSQQPCSDATRTQRWQAVAHGGTVHLVNAISQLDLAEGPDGGAVQTAPDVQAPAELTAVRAQG